MVKRLLRKLYRKILTRDLQELPQENTVRDLIENMILEDPASRIQLQRVIEVLTELAVSTKFKKFYL